MRRYDENDEVDVVIVGAGAGGGTLAQRLARAGWRTVVLDAGPFWNPDTDWVSDERGVTRPVLDRLPADRRLRPDPVGLQQLRARRRRIDGALRGLCPAVSPVGLPHPQRRRRGRGLADQLRHATALLREDRSRAARRRTGLAMGRSTSLPAQPASGQRQRSDCAARSRGTRDSDAGRAGRHPQRPLRQPAALYLSRLLPAGLQGQRQGQPVDHPHPRCVGPRRRDPPRRAGLAGARRRRDRAGDRCRVLPRRSPAPATCQRGRRRGLLDRDAAPIAAVGHRPLRARLRQRPRSSRPLPDGSGRTPDRGAVQR